MQKHNTAECNNCGIPFQIITNQDGKAVCPICEKSDYTITGVDVTFRGKFLYLEAESIDDYIEATEKQLRKLKKLKKKGYEMGERGSPRDDYHTLHRDYD